MIVVLSGEGPTDIGTCTIESDQCTIPEFSVGPMCIIIDKLIVLSHGYSPLEQTPDSYKFFKESALKKKAEERKRERKFSLSGKKHTTETGYFHINAWMLGELAKELENQEGDTSIAILFRDTDGTNSTPKDLWTQKFQSMLSGFARAEYDRGIPMLPLPKSEAWLLCAMKNNPYQNCGQLEELPGNDASPNAAKRQLAEALGGQATKQDIMEWLQDNHFDDSLIANQMPSFYAFRQRALEVLSSL